MVQEESSFVEIMEALARYAETFQIKYYESTNGWCKHIRQTLYSINIDRELAVKDVLHLFPVYWFWQDLPEKQLHGPVFGSRRPDVDNWEHICIYHSESFLLCRWWMFEVKLIVKTADYFLINPTTTLSINVALFYSAAKPALTELSMVYAH